MAEITIPLVLDIIRTLGILVGIIYYITIIRNAQRSRQRELIFQRFQGYSKDYIQTYFEVASYRDWETVEDWRNKYGLPMNVEADTKWTYIMSLYNMAGLLLKEKEVDPDLIFLLYPPHVVIRLWEQFEPVIQSLRERTHPVHLEPFEFLYHEAKKRYPEIDPWSTLDKLEMTA